MFHQNSKTMSKTSISFYLNLSKKSPKTGKVPVYLRIVNNRDKAETRLSLDLSENDILLWNPRIMRVEDNKLPVNKLLNKYQQQFEELIYQNNDKLNELSAKQLRDQLMGKKVSYGDSAIGFMWEYYHNAIINRSSIEEGTKKNYKKAINHFERFLTHVNKSDLPLSDFNITISNEFKDYLLSSFPLKEKKAVTESTASGTIKKLKAILQRAVDEEKLNRNPFSGIKLKAQSRYREKLNSHEIKAIQQYNFTEFPTLDKVRDIFMFSVFTGLAYNDAMSLKKNQLQTWQDKDTYIHLKRTKTDVETRQFLVSQANTIIEKYKTAMTYKETLLPPISNQQLNMRLKTIAERAGIHKPLTSHIARHSFRQLLSEAGLTDLAAIKTMMGHTRNHDIDAIYHTVTEKQLLDAKRQFQQFLNELFK